MAIAMEIVYMSDKQQLLNDLELLNTYALARANDAIYAIKFMPVEFIESWGRIKTDIIVATERIRRNIDAN